MEWPSELLHGAEGTRRGSLLERVDDCATPAGKRLLRRWLLAPLTDPRAIAERQDAVQALANDARALDDWRRAARRAPA
jgi:DNA mismatch repair protein MutS